MRILIANRGEIARRVIRTAHRLGHQTVAVYADPDASAPFVAEATMSARLGPAALDESYLSVPRLLDAARTTGADAVHPGYGFLSENADFARAVSDAGLTWIGPRPDVIELMGSKIAARRQASAAGVPIIAGFDRSQNDDDLASAADDIGYPVLIKAAAGGGGKGIRIALDPSEFGAALAEARAESARSFGDDAVIVERYITRPRHVEVQVIGDRHGNAIDLGTRECSVQRRYQKVLEEAPAPNLAAATTTTLRETARALAQSIGYDSVGTVEFVVDDETGDGFFLEMNTRLQVEHPVTELITGLDLVELQLAVAEGQPIPLSQDDVTFSGHAFEARINAEDADAGFAPQIGRIDAIVAPEWVRWDSGVEAGSEISPHYDSMVAKLVVGGPERDIARRRLARALDELVVAGPVTTAGFHRWLIDQPPIVAGRVTTRFLDETDIAPRPPASSAAEAAAMVWRDAAPPGSGPWHAQSALRFTPHRPSLPTMLIDRHTGDRHEVTPTTAAVDVEGTAAAPSAHWVDREAAVVAVNVGGHHLTFDVPTRTEVWGATASGDHGSAAALVAPFPAVVNAVLAQPGDRVEGGDPVVVIEAMKMLHTLAAPTNTVIDAVLVSPGDTVASGDTLVTFEPTDPDPTATTEHTETES